MTNGIPADMNPPDLEHVPTVAELLKRGLVNAVVSKQFDPIAWKSKSETRYTISSEGQRLIYDAQKRNAERCRAWSRDAVDADRV